jgi:putative transposase
LTAAIEWYSRYVLAWELANAMESRFFVYALEHALKQGKSDIFNTDQGSRFT